MLPRWYFYCIWYTTNVTLEGYIHSNTHPHNTTGPQRGPWHERSYGVHALAARPSSFRKELPLHHILCSQLFTQRYRHLLNGSGHRQNLEPDDIFSSKTRNVLGGWSSRVWNHRCAPSCGLCVASVRRRVCETCLEIASLTERPCYDLAMIHPHLLQISTKCNFSA